MDVISRRTYYDWILEGIAFLGLICAFLPLFYYNQLGDKKLIPTHYNMYGEIDGWEGRESLFVLALVVLLIYTGLLFTEKFYKKFNYPIKIKDKNATHIYRTGIRLQRHLRALIMIFFAYLNISGLMVGLGKCSGASGFIIILFPICLLGLLIFFCIQMYAYREE